MKLFLFLFYESVKALVWFVRWFYYAERTLVNPSKRWHKGPCILVSNHPGTMMDPLNVAVLMKRRVHFLANASLFKTPFTNWFFSTFYCIKVERYADTGGRPLNNNEAFRMATQHLTKGGCLYMAPEGGSIAGRQLQPLKTGLARIAFNTEEEMDFRLGLTILPVGLNYSVPGEFRSRLLTVMGEPFTITSFQEDWQTDKLAAVRKLTAHLEEKMKAVMIHTDGPEQDLLLKRLETILQTENPLAGAPLFDRSKALSLSLHDLCTKKPTQYEEIKENTAAYFEKLASLRTTDTVVAGKGKVPFLAMLLVFPLFLVGFAIHFLPAYFTKKTADRLSTDPAWLPTYKVMGGLVIYPVVLWLQYLLVRYLAGCFWEMPQWSAWAYLLAMLPCGLVAEWFLGKWETWQHTRRWERFAKRQPEEAEEWSGRRKHIKGMTPTNDLQ